MCFPINVACQQLHLACGLQFSTPVFCACIDEIYHMVLYLCLVVTFLSLLRYLQVWDLCLCSVVPVTQSPQAEHDVCVSAPSTAARIDGIDMVFQYLYTKSGCFTRMCIPGLLECWTPLTKTTKFGDSWWQARVVYRFFEATWNHTTI